MKVLIIGDGKSGRAAFRLAELLHFDPITVTDGTVLRALAVAADLCFTETGCTWTPLTE